MMGYVEGREWWFFYRSILIVVVVVISWMRPVGDALDDGVTATSQHQTHVVS